MDTAFIILALLFVKHFVCDFVVQYPYMVQEKGTYGAAGGIHHALLHFLGTFFVLVWFIHPFWAAVWAAVDGVVHYHIDWAKMNINRVWKYTIEQPQFWAWLGADQLAHSLTYVAMTAIIVS